MKICIPVASPCGLHAVLEPDLLAARHVLIADTEDDTVRVLDRRACEPADEALIASAEAAFCGRQQQALALELQASGIEVFMCDTDAAGDLLQAYREGRLLPAPAMSAAS